MKIFLTSSHTCSELTPGGTQFAVEMVEGRICVERRRHPIGASGKIKQEADSISGLFQVITDKEPKISVLQILLE